MLNNEEFEKKLKGIKCFYWILMEPCVRKISFTLIFVQGNYYGGSIQTSLTSLLVTAHKI